MDYTLYHQSGAAGACFRFLGGFESATDDHVLWARGDNLTISIDMDGAAIYALPSANMVSTDGVLELDGEPPERIQWDRVAALDEGSKVYVGGALVDRDGQLVFASTKETPLLIIFYDGTEKTLMPRTIWAGRQKNEYWNPLTPFSLTLGIACQLVLAISYFPRPAFRSSAIYAIVAVFGPLFPLMPPGVLFTALYRRLWRRARMYRACRDLIRLPLRHAVAGDGGNPYGYLTFPSLPDAGDDALLVPFLENQSTISEWRWYGMLARDENGILQVREPKDPMVAYGLVPGPLDRIVQEFNRKARFFEFASWTVLLAGIVVNCLLAILIVQLFR